jgi:hypothetical protein
MPGDQRLPLRAVKALIIATQIRVAEGIAVRAKGSERRIITGRVVIPAVLPWMIAVAVDTVASAVL